MSFQKSSAKPFIAIALVAFIGGLLYLTVGILSGPDATDTAAADAGVGSPRNRCCQGKTCPGCRPGENGENHAPGTGQKKANEAT